MTIVRWRAWERDGWVGCVHGNVGWVRFRVGYRGTHGEEDASADRSRGTWGLLDCRIIGVWRVVRVWRDGVEVGEGCLLREEVWWEGEVVFWHGLRAVVGEDVGFGERVECSSVSLEI